MAERFRDTITGGLGADTLTGGSGKVTFAYNSNLDSTVSKQVELLRDVVPNLDRLAVFGQREQSYEQAPGRGGSGGGPRARPSRSRHWTCAEPTISRPRSLHSMVARTRFTVAADPLFFNNMPTISALAALTTRATRRFGGSNWARICGLRSPHSTSPCPFPSYQQTCAGAGGKLALVYRPCPASRAASLVACRRGASAATA